MKYCEEGHVKTGPMKPSEAMVKDKIPSRVQAAYARLGDWLSLNALEIGLINKTYVLETTLGKYILQEVSPIFDVTIHDDCDAVAHYLKPKGIKAPFLQPTDKGALFMREEGHIFRILSLIDGKSYNKIQSLKMAEQAGLIVGRFHHAMKDFDYTYQSIRRHGGDYAFHLQNLKAALKAHAEHDYFALVLPLAERMIGDMVALTHGLTTTARHAHGDPKISNILFDDNDEAVCLVDFDTLGTSGWSLELGDALRSWCNPNKEDDLNAHVDLAITEKALAGYAQQMRGMLTEKELSELNIHVPAITLCVAIRYLYDVLNETYWAYDQTRFQRPAEHNWLRAQAMYKLYSDFRRHEGILRDLSYSLLL